MLKNNAENILTSVFSILLKIRLIRKNKSVFVTVGDYITGGTLQKVERIRQTDA